MKIISELQCWINCFGMYRIPAFNIPHYRKRFGILGNSYRISLDMLSDIKKGASNEKN